MNVEVAFAPTPVYVEAFGVKKATEQAKLCRKDLFTDRCDTFLSVEEEDPIEAQKERARAELKAALMFLGTGFLMGFCLARLL